MDAAARRRLLIALVFVAIALNYVDRQMLALLKPTLQARFRWNDRTMRLSAPRFRSRRPSPMPARLVRRPGRGPRVALGWGVGVWSVAGMAHAFAATMPQFVAARVVLAAAETVGTPAAVKSAATYLPVARTLVRAGARQHRAQHRRDRHAAADPAAGARVRLAGGVPRHRRARASLWVVAGSPARGGLVAVDAAAPERAATDWTAAVRATARTLAIVGAKVLQRPGVVLPAVLAARLLRPRVPHEPGDARRAGGARLHLRRARVRCRRGCCSRALLRARAGAWTAARKGSMLFYALLILPLPLAIVAPGPWAAAVVIGLGAVRPPGLFDQRLRAGGGHRAGRAGGDGGRRRRGRGQSVGRGADRVCRLVPANGYGYWPMLGVCAVAYLAALGWVQALMPEIQAAHA